MAARTRLSYIVPTVGSSPLLRQCLAALGDGEKAPLVLAAPLDAGVEDLTSRLPDIRCVTVHRGDGYAGACNLAIASVESDYVAIVNDDAVADAAWADRLQALLDSDPGLAAAQGTNVQLADPARVDGCGIGWNRSWQAVQLLRDQPLPVSTSPREIFGASGTAVVLRRQALEATALSTGSYFDPILGTYYEDVELACRLRAGGYRAAHLPGAWVRHAGAASSARRASWRWRQVYGNRLLVLARLWGRAYPSLLPRVLGRDLLDLASACLSLQRPRVRGILSGWARAAHHLRSFAHRGQPLLTSTELRRFQISGTEGDEGR